MALFYLLIFGGGAALSSALLTKFMIWINIQDIPNNRSSHVKITPKSGGIAVAFPFFGFLSLYYYFNSNLDKDHLFFHPLSMILLFASLVIVGMGFWDDMRGLSWRVRLSVQVAVSLLMVGAGVYLKTLSLPFFGVIPLGFFGPLLSGLGIVAFMNIYNFMDGLNGLAIGSTLIALLFYGMIILCLNLDNVGSFTFFCLTFLASALLPLFFFNFPRGRIFLGDAGSQFLGFILPILGILGTFQFPEGFKGAGFEGLGVSPFLIPLLFFNFIFDGLLTLILRALRGRKIWEADRNHLFHMLLDRNISPQKVSYLHFIFFMIQGFIAVYFTFCIPLRFFIFGVGIVFILHLLYAYWLLRGPSKKREIHA